MPGDEIPAMRKSKPEQTADLKQQQCPLYFKHVTINSLKPNVCTSFNCYHVTHLLYLMYNHFMETFHFFVNKWQTANQGLLLEAIWSSIIVCVCVVQRDHTISSVVSSSQNTVLHSSLCEDFIFLNQTTTLMKTDVSQRCVGNQELPFITIPSFTPPYFI